MKIGDMVNHPRLFASMRVIYVRPVASDSTRGPEQRLGIVAVDASGYGHEWVTREDGQPTSTYGRSPNPAALVAGMDRWIQWQAEDTR
jgi:hypothetical protein